MVALPGRFNDGRTAASRKVMVSPSAAGLDIRGEDGLLVAFWRIDDLRADGELPDGGVRLRCAADPDARLSMTQAEFVRPLLPPPPRFPWSKAVAALIGTAGLLAALWLGIPAASRWLGDMVPRSWENAWGDALVTGLEKQWGACGQPAGDAALRLLVDRLSTGLEPSQRPRRVLVVRQRDVNAIALPGGTVMVFSGLLKDARDPGELAGVLAHEFTHLRLRHPVAAMIRATGVGVAVTLITGDSSGVVATAAAMGLAGAYSREDEAAADTGGVAVLRSAGLDARGMASFFRRLGEKPGMVPVWLSTHPDSLARAEAVEALDGPAAAPPLTGEQWQALKGICEAEKEKP